MNADKANFEMVRTVVALARGSGMNGTAEGIETAEQLPQPRALQCQRGQGYLGSKSPDSHGAALLFSSHGDTGDGGLTRLLFPSSHLRSWGASLFRALLIFSASQSLSGSGQWLSF